jgi:hypothetical protein
MSSTSPTRKATLSFNLETLGVGPGFFDALWIEIDADTAPGPEAVHGQDDDASVAAA